MVRKKRDPQGAPAWMVTYGDMMTLLLVFFILLYTVFYFQTESFKRDLAKIEIERVRSYGDNDHDSDSD